MKKGKAKEVSGTQDGKPLMQGEGRERNASAFAGAGAGATGGLAPAGAGAAGAPAVAAPAKPQFKRDSPLSVMVASMIGTAIEFYDNYCYSIAAASYFGLIFFTDVAKSDPVLATLLSFRHLFGQLFGASVRKPSVRPFWR